MNWFNNLPPGEQITLLLVLFGWIFNLGVYAATVRFLSKKVKDHDTRLDKHSDKLEEHGEDIAALKAARG
jgi:hypothetical protein